MSLWDDIGSVPLGFLEDLFNKGWLIYVIIGIAGVAVYLLFFR